MTDTDDNNVPLTTQELNLIVVAMEYNEDRISRAAEELPVDEYLKGVRELTQKLKSFVYARLTEKDDK